MFAFPKRASVRVADLVGVGSALIDLKNVELQQK
jgi:hypothetical protein